MVKLSGNVKKQASKLLDKGMSVAEVAGKFKVSSRQVAAIKAWKTMGFDYENSGKVKGGSLKTKSLSELVSVLESTVEEIRSRLG
jgi:transposase